MNSKHSMIKNFLFILISILICIFFNIFNIGVDYQIKVAFFIFAVYIIINIIYDILNRTVYKYILIFNIVALLLCIIVIFR